MHRKSYQLMRKVIRLNFDKDTQMRVLDVGSHAGEDYENVGYRAIFARNENWIYEGMDLRRGNNVDIVVSEPYRWDEIKDQTYDLVISGQVMEHLEAPWLWVKEVERVCKPGGRCVVIAPFVWHQHRYPVDCYRYLPDGMRYLFTKVAKFEQIRCRLVGDDCLFYGKRIQ